MTPKDRLIAKALARRFTLVDLGLVVLMTGLGVTAGFNVYCYITDHDPVVLSKDPPPKTLCFDARDFAD